MKCLVVYYSRTGVTKEVGDKIANSLGCDVEEVKSAKNRKGVIGYLLSGKEAMKKTPANIEKVKKDSASYDMVIVGTPVWAWNMSSPIRMYLRVNKDRIKKVAFFCTQGGSGAEKTFLEMGKIIGSNPVATLDLKTVEVKKEDYSSKVNEFTSKFK
ncbi:MAG: flavodoxin [Nanoarchaeota archaeon]|nr:flavodoxin [Nanoarchaeota archaeon]